MIPSSAGPFVERTPCPSCGGAGGGPIGRAGSSWDDEEYVCPKCEGEGVILISPEQPGDVLSQQIVGGPGIVKVAREAAEELASKQKATG